MDWKEAVSKITSVAPLVGSLFGPGGILIGTSVKLLASALGVEPSEEAVMKEIASNPDALLKLKEFEGNNRIELQKLALQQLGMAYADTADARKRQVEHEKATGKSDTNLYVLAWAVVVGFFLLLGLLLKFDIPAEQSPVVFMLFGALSTGFGQVLQYFFGSSKGSSDKTDVLAGVAHRK